MLLEERIEYNDLVDKITDELISNYAGKDNTPVKGNEDRAKDGDFLFHYPTYLFVLKYVIGLFLAEISLHLLMGSVFLFKIYFLYHL